MGESKLEYCGLTAMSIIYIRCKVHRGLFDRRLYETSRQRFDARVVLSGYLARTVGARDVDLVGLDDAPPTLVRTVMTQGLRVFCANAEADQAARRTALSRAADLEPFLRRMRRIKLDAIAR
jgi:hypothetical protein